MHRLSLSAIAAVSIILSTLHAPVAHADDRDLARLLAGIAALAIIGKAIHDRNDDRQVTRNDDRYRPIPHRDQSRGPQVITPRPLPQSVARKSLPRQCLRQVQTRNGNVRRAFGARCLDRNFRYSNQLPRQCARQVETQRGWRWMYGARCLRNNGYQIAHY